MSEIVHYEGQDSWARMIGPVGDLANRIAGTEFVSRSFRGKPASVAAAILAGRELELGPLTALRGLQVIDGSVSMTAQMMAAKILAANHRIEWVESTDKAAEVRITRGDGLGEAQARFTIADAQRAGLAGKKNWQQWPRAMCRARALSECAGMIAPDCILGLDAADQQDEPQRPAGDVTVVRLAPAPTEPPERLPEGPPTPTAVAEPAPEAPPAAPERGAVPLVTAAQLRKINAQLGELDRIEGRRLTRDERRDLIAALAGATGLASAKELTREQAGAAIEALDRAIGAALQQQEVDGVVDAVIVDEEGQPGE